MEQTRRDRNLITPSLPREKRETRCKTGSYRFLLNQPHNPKVEGSNPSPATNPFNHLLFSSSHFPHSHGPFCPCSCPCFPRLPKISGRDWGSGRREIMKSEVLPHVSWRACRECGAVQREDCEHASRLPINTTTVCLKTGRSCRSCRSYSRTSSPKN